MLVPALLLAVCAGACARVFNVTYLDVPQEVAPEVQFVQIECRYDADFTILSWFKGNREFFRYRPGSAPSTRTFPLAGVESVEIMTCGPTQCMLKLGGLSPAATGLYRCDLERDKPPYLFASMVAHMDVHRTERRQPLLEGLAEEYKDGDMIQAYCRGEPKSQIRWYINGKELEEFRGKSRLKTEAHRVLFKGRARMISVQCAEFIYGKMHGSIEHNARLCEEVIQIPPMQKEPLHKVVKGEKEMKVVVLCNNGSSIITGCLALLSVILNFLGKSLCV